LFSTALAVGLGFNDDGLVDFVGPELLDIAFALVRGPRVVLAIKATHSRAVP
jgi:hypothetical protein